MASPADLARAAAARKSGSSHPELVGMLSRNFAQIDRLAASIGIDVGDAIDSWVRAEGPAEVRQWLSRNSSDTFVASAWTVRTAMGDSPSALATLVREQQLSDRGAGVGAYLRSAGSGYAEAIGRSRVEVALALLAHANGIPFHKPVTLMRASEIAR